MFETLSTSAIAVVALLAKTIATGVPPVAFITTTLPDIPDGAFVLALHGGVDQDAPNSDQLKARQDVRIRIKEQPQTSHIIQHHQQEQSIKEKYPALQSYYRSLARRILRTQKDRIAAPEDPSLP